MAALADAETLGGMHILRFRPASVALALVAALLVTTLPATTPPVAAWANNGDRFGTHDWILYQAARALGGAPDWLDLDVALPHTDDPDGDRNADDFLLRGHVYKEKGRRGGGPNAVVQYYAAAVEAYRRGEALDAAGNHAAAREAWDDASRAVGIMAHFVGDLGQPFHSAYAATNDETLHHRYESDLVAPITRSPDSLSAWRVQGSVAPSANVRRTAAGTAAYSRQFYPELRQHLANNPGRLDARALEITGLVLRRSSADLASIIASVADGRGLDPELSISVVMRATRVPVAGGARIGIRVTDPAGNGVEGVMFMARVPDANGRSHVEHWATDENGDAHFYWRVRGLPTRTVITVPVTARIGTTERSWSPWFKVVP